MIPQCLSAFINVTPFGCSPDRAAALKGKPSGTSVRSTGLESCQDLNLKVNTVLMRRWYNYSEQRLSVTGC